MIPPTLILVTLFTILQTLHGFPQFPVSSSDNFYNVSFSTLQYHEDTHLTARQLIRKYGFRGETHRVTTRDGYILEMHRITGPTSNPDPVGKPVVFLMHGLLSSSVDWIISGPEKALGYILANNGYDVWMGNARGNKYSRRHRDLSVLDKEYWSFSWHEIGVEDLPAMIDHVLLETNRKELFYVGHSQGTTSFFVMASTKPEYNRKITAMFALAPVAYLRHMTSPFFKILSKFDTSITTVMDMMGLYEFQPTPHFMKELKTEICNDDAWTQPICENILLLIAGMGTDQLNKTQLPTILGHVPAGSSTKQFLHYSQLIKSNKFRQFDYGWIGNLKRYGQSSPPDYDLSKITTPVTLHYSVNDWLSHVRDVSRLNNRLPNIHKFLKVPHEKFAHLDYLWGIDAKQLLYSETMRIMSQFLK